MENTNQKSTGDFKIPTNWTEISKELKSKYPALTDADLKFESGKDLDLLKRLETRLNKSRLDVIDILRKSQVKLA